MWSFETHHNLIGCGVDVEGVDRFEGISAAENHPMPFVFTRNEIDHARSGPNPAQVLCLTFACKEALLKAAGQPYDYTLCEILPSVREASLDGDAEQEIRLAPGLKDALKAEYANFRWRRLTEGSGEMLSTVYLFGEERPQ